MSAPARRRLRPLSRLALLLGALSLLACVHPGAGTRRMDRVEDKIDRLLAGQDRQQAALDELLGLARAQGSGELTLFFPWASSALSAQERDRLVNFADHLAREAHGRPVLLVSVGTATDWRSPGWNGPLSRRRAEAPRAVLSQHLVHVPHRWVKVLARGAEGAPVGARGKTYRNARVIAVFDERALDGLLNSASPAEALNGP